MKNKKIYKFGVENDSFFIEKRLVFQDPPPKKTPPPTGSGPEKEPTPAPKPAPKREAEKAEEKREKGGIETETEAERERVKAKGQVEREKVKPVQLPTTPPLKMEDFKEKADSREHKKELDLLKINILREGKQSNAQKWNHFSEDGLKEIYRDCREAGIPVNDPFYKSMFAILNMGIHQSTNTHLKDPDYQIYFQDPANHMKDLLGLGVCPSGFDPVAFAKAYEHLQYIQGVLLAQDAHQVKTLAAQEGLDKDPVATKVTDFLKSNLDQFKKAIKERDYATAGMYCVGIWAIYRSMKEIGVFGKDGKGTKYLAYGLALYCGSVFAKNAGYDILKIAGFRDQNYEVKGTPLEAIDNILRSRPHLRELAKDLDYGITLRMSEVSLVDLHEFFKDSNKNGVQFIHPYQFPEIFGDLAREWPFKMGVGEEGLKDYTGMGNTKLTTGQREYIRVGKQLYKLALAMQGVYESTLYTEHPDYKGLPYEKMLRDPTKKLGKIRHLLGAAYDYAPAKPERSLMSTKTIDEAEERLSKAFTGLEVGLHLERQINKSGHFQGKLMEYPVVFVQTGKVYRVYLKPSYKGEEQPGRDYIAEIPIEEGSKQILEVRKAVDGVKDKMWQLLTPLHGTGGRSITKTSLKYEYGEWSCDVTLPGSPEFGIASKPSKAILKPHPEGRGIDVVAENGVIINLDELVAKQYPVAFALIPAVVAQEEFHALQAFSNARAIKFKDEVAGDKKFTLLIGGNNIPFEFQYDSGTKKFTLLNEAKIVGDPVFAQEYVKALQDSPLFALNVTAKKLKEAINVSPENIFPYVWDKITGQTRDPQLGRLNLDILSKSIPDYLSYTVVDVTIYESLQRVRRMIGGAKTLKEVDSIKSLILHDVNARLEGVYEMLTASNMDMDSWDREDYMFMVINPIRNAGGTSSEYQRLKTEFEVHAYQLAGGVMTSDLTQAPHKRSAELMKVYAYYTSYLDNHSYTFKSPTGAMETGIVNLDDPTPPKAKYPGQVPPHLDPGLRKYYIQNYFKYVQQEIMNKAKGKDSLDTIPDGSAQGFWGIDNFDKWAVERGIAKPLDDLDNYPPYTHNKTLHAKTKPDGTLDPQYTELEQSIMNEFDKVTTQLMDEFGYSVLNYRAIQKYLRQKGPGVKPSDMGVFTRYKENATSPLKCTLWDWAESISSLTTRKQQVKAIQALAQERLIRHIIENKKEFFISETSFKTKILRRFPGLADISWIPDAVNPFAP